jgi:lipid II isoglutaminyl synthase (glutamine-hydrolysing)
MTQKIHILHIYPNEMNTYGDRGNLLTLLKRSEWHGLDPEVHYYHPGGQLPKNIDMILGGGGQDAAQVEIGQDIQRISKQLHQLSADMVPMLMVCGTYQLFGNVFKTYEGHEIPGIGIFDLETIGGTKRLIGNAAVQTDDFGTLYGFENHSGRTYLKNRQPLLGTVTRGKGNNGEDGTEGARTNNTIGIYLHGPLLPLNPQLADGLLTLAMQRHDAIFNLQPIDDTLVTASRQAAAQRAY